MTDDVFRLAEVLYESERKVGWDPGWVNAHSDVRNKYLAQARDYLSAMAATEAGR